MLEDFYDPDEDYPDGDEIFEREQELLADCVCGAFLWSEKLGELVQVADCVCGKT